MDAPDSRSKGHSRHASALLRVGKLAAIASGVASVQLACSGLIADESREGGAGALLDGATGGFVGDDGGVVDGPYGDGATDQGSSTGPDARGGSDGVDTSEGHCGKCNGCCEGATCISIGDDTDHCGVDGTKCRACPAGDLCSKFGCGAVTSEPCSPATCAGCCVAPDVCAVGKDLIACGHDGMLCGDCRNLGAACVAVDGGGGTCAAGCTTANCPNGCCLGGVCVVNEASSCGPSCIDCAAKGQECSDGACTGTCGPQNCAGCCLGDLCALGSQDLACGSGGVRCTDCTGTFGAPKSCGGDSECH